LRRKVLKVTDNPEQGARLESLIEALNLTQTSLAQILGISQSYVSQMVGGSRNISRRVLHFITNNYPKVDVRWLMTGEGEMFLEKQEPEAGALVGVMEPGAVYERGGSVGLLEGVFARLAWLEDRVAELEARLRVMEEGGKGG